MFKKRFSGLAVPLATFLFSAVLAFAVNPAMGLFGLLAAGGTTGGQKPCEIKIFRDLPYFTKVLDDWPLQGTCPRSPKYVFGKERPITIEVHLPDTAYAKVVVQVTNKDLAAPGPKTIDIECDHVGSGVYRSRVAGFDEVLYLADHTEERSDGDLIHVREEEVLEFVLKEPSDPNCKIDVMVDRGEAAATTVVENDPIMRGGFDGAATRFMDGAKAFDEDTTFWWDVGRSLGNAAFTEFLLNAGADDTTNNNLPNWESDILFWGAHGDPVGNLYGAGGQVFGPDASKFWRKPGTGDKTKPREVPKDFYADYSAPSPTFGAGGRTWDTDIDWALAYSCSTLFDFSYDVGTTVFDAAGKGTFVPANPPRTQRAYEAWKNAFKQGGRRPHGILGYTTYGSNNLVILKVIPQWIKLVKQGRSIPSAWRSAVAEKDPESGAAILYMERNWSDTIDLMQRDPCPEDVPMYWTSGIRQKGDSKKGGKAAPPVKPIVDGKLHAGVTPRDMTPNTSFVEEPKRQILGGRCGVAVPFPTLPGRYPRLQLTRSETLKPGSVFSPDDEGIYRFDAAVPFGQIVPNSVTPEAAETNLRTFLSNNFANLPALPAYGVYEGSGGVLDGVSEPVATRFEIVLEQRYKELPVFDSGVYAALTPSGVVEGARAILYGAAPTGTAIDVISARQATEIAALDFLSRFPGRPCVVTLIFPFYGEPSDVAPGVKEVRPVWGIQFSNGEFVATLDAVTGAILRVEGP